MIISLTTLLATLSSIFRSRAALELENLALRHQIGVLQRSARKRQKWTSADRLLWIFLSCFWRGWRSALAIIKPETVLAWHRAGFRLFWTDCEAVDPAAPEVHSLPVLLARGPRLPLYQIVLASNKLPGSECRPKSYPAAALFPNSWCAV